MWDDFLNAALFACRIRTHSTTGFSPFYLTYGCEPVLPGDVLQPYIDKHTMADRRTVDDLTSRELEILQQNRAAAEFGMKATAARDKIKWDAAIKKVSYEISDKVLLTHEGRFGLEPTFKGPYIVVKTNMETGTYLLQTLAGQPLASCVHTDRLTAAKGKDIIKPWYNPTESRREWRAAMGGTSTTQSLGNKNSLPTPSHPIYQYAIMLIQCRHQPLQRKSSGYTPKGPIAAPTQISSPSQQPDLPSHERGRTIVQVGNNVDIIPDKDPNQVIEEVSWRPAKRKTTLGGVPKRSYAPTVTFSKRRRLEPHS